MKNKKIILVTMSSQEEHSKVYNHFLTKLNKFDFLPILVSGYMSQATRNYWYKKSAGVLFSGGVDFDPKWYGQKKHPKTYIDAQRDDLELDILGRTLKDQKPFLGICRGAQALAIACGGSLIQYLPDITEEKHGTSEEEAFEAHLLHEVLIVPDTKAQRIFQEKSKLQIISGHHQAIDDPGKLIVSGKSPGGIIEIVEHPTLPFHFGIQGHPEFGGEDSLDRVFQSFSDAIN